MGDVVDEAADLCFWIGNLPPGTEGATPMYARACSLRDALASRDEELVRVRGELADAKEYIAFCEEHSDADHRVIMRLGADIESQLADARRGMREEAAKALDVASQETAARLVSAPRSVTLSSAARLVRALPVEAVATPADPTQPAKG